MKRLYCGHENAIEVLDITNPGYDSTERLKTVPTRREKGGQRGIQFPWSKLNTELTDDGCPGIISSIAFSPDYSGVFAAGSFSGSVSLYSEDTGGIPIQHIGGIVGGGVTQVNMVAIFQVNRLMARFALDRFQSLESNINVCC